MPTPNIEGDKKKGEWLEIARDSAEYSNLSQNIQTIVFNYIREFPPRDNSAVDMADEIINLCKQYICQKK